MEAYQAPLETLSILFILVKMVSSSALSIGYDTFPFAGLSNHTEKCCRACLLHRKGLA